MKKILFVVDDKAIGGVSIVLEDILNNISHDNKKIDLLILKNEGDRLNNLKKEINIIYGTKFFKNVNVSFSDVLKNGNIKDILKKIYLIFLIKSNLIKFKIKRERKKILTENYNIEIAFKYGFCSLFTFYGNSLKKINWVHCDCKNNDPALKYRNLFKKILPLFDLNILLSKANEHNFNEIYNCKNTRIINNLVSENKIKDRTKNVNYIEIDKIRFVSIGRYSKEKGYDLLIEAFNLLKQDNLLDGVTLNIYGEGKEKNNLNKLINNYNLNNTIYLNPKTDNPYKMVKESDMFILSSLTEAYPLVIIESLITGTPVLSTNVSSVNEILNKNYGMIVDISIDGLYNGIRKIILNKNILKQYRNNLSNYIYRTDDIINKVEEVLK